MAFANMLSLDVRSVLYHTPMVWSGLALLFNAIAYLRIRFSRGALRGWTLTVIGLGLSSLMFLLLVFIRLSHKHVTGPI